ncbi:hypothetical protein ACFXGI_21385 [Streptomyces sp. NPDC059355]|uniref:hypothetical protein n=1 Tax=Streptomyces sp. NPDC059355 TaxID=3346811 RepID=UPI0036AB688C
MLRSAEDLRRLPVRRHEHAPACAPEFLSVSSGLGFSIGGQRHAALGFGCSRSPERSRDSALWETYERLLMVAEISGSLGRRVHGTTRSGATTGSRPFEDIVPRPWHSTYRPGLDATGLAVHATTPAARLSAERELLERTLLATIWYGTEPLPSEITDHSCVTRGRMRTYTFGCRLGFFSLAAWHDPDSEIFVIGSAVRESREQAVEHALSEAVMVYDGVWEGRTPRYHTSLSRGRYESLRGELHVPRARHLAARLVGGGRPSAGSEPLGDEITLYQLVEWEGVSLVRAVAPEGANTLKARRRQGRAVPPDPFT